LCPRTYFSFQLKQSPSRRRTSISSGDKRLIVRPATLPVCGDDDEDAPSCGVATVSVLGVPGASE
jgi:hypothetical protein